MTRKAATARLTVLPGATAGPAERLLFAARSVLACRLDADGRIVEPSAALEAAVGGGPAGVTLVELLVPPIDPSLADALAAPPGADRAFPATLISALVEPLPVVVRVVRDGSGALVTLEPVPERGGRVERANLGAVVVVDIDGLERANERYGRDVGDGIVRAVSGILEACARRSDLIERDDDATFTATLAGCSLDDAVVWAERIRARLREVRTLGSGEALTASFGVAEIRSGDDAGSASRRAEAALRLAKSEGRDRVRVAR